MKHIADIADNIVNIIFKFTDCVVKVIGLRALYEVTG